MDRPEVPCQHEVVIEEIRFHSSTLGIPHRSLVLRPDPIEEHAGPLPTLYLFRGLADEWFWSPQERGGRNLETVVGDLTARHWLEPLVVVCPDSTVNSGGVQLVGAGFDLVHVPNGEESSLGTGRFREFFANEYFDRVERKLFHGQRATARAIGGFSIGSLAAFSLAFFRPALFVAASSYDGAFLYWNHDHPEGAGPPENDLRLDLFPYWFGNPPSFEVFSRSDPWSLLQSAAGRNLGDIRRLTFFQHWSAEVHSTANAWREEKMRQSLVDWGCSQGFEEGLLSPEARHDWYWVDEHLYRLLPRVGHLLRQAQADR